MPKKRYWRIQRGYYQQWRGWNKETKRKALFEKKLSLKADSEEEVNDDKAETWEDPEENKALEGNEDKKVFLNIMIGDKDEDKDCGMNDIHISPPWP